MDTKNTAFKDWLFERISLDEISYRALGRAVGVSPSTVAHWISGRSIPEPANCIALAEHFGLDQDFVLALAGHRPHPGAEIDLDDPFVHFWASHSADLTEEAKRALMELARPYIEAKRTRERG